MGNPIKIAITGAAGQIGYALLFRVASGELLGHNQPLDLRLVDLPQAQNTLQGIVMELEDCAFPLVHSITATDSLKVGFEGIDWAFLIGGHSRKNGMEREELLRANGPIFVEQGKALARYAGSNVRILVVANPCNANCLIARHHARDIPIDRWFALSRLDENRSKAFIAKKAGTEPQYVKRVAIWGNHSPTLYPDFHSITVASKPACDVIPDRHWWYNVFLPTIRGRGTAVIKARGASSSASAAQAIIDTVHSLTQPIPPDDWHSVGVYCNGQIYGLPPDIVASVPITYNKGTWSPIENLLLAEESLQYLQITTAELLEEKNKIRDLLG